MLYKSHFIVGAHGAGGAGGLMSVPRYDGVPRDSQPRKPSGTPSEMGKRQNANT